MRRRPLTTTEAALELGATPAWVREHAHEMGGFRLGGTGHLRFPAADVERAKERWTLRKDEPKKTRSRPGPRARGRVLIPADTRDW